MLDEKRPQHESRSSTYHLSANAAATHRPSQFFAPLSYAHLDLSAYRPPGSQISPDKSTITIQSAPLTSDAAALEAFLLKQIDLPPRPTIRIHANIPGQLIPLFDLHFDLLRHISPCEESHGEFAYTILDGKPETRQSIRRIGDGVPTGVKGQADPTGVGFWLRRFCVSDTTSPKRFVFKRGISHLDTAYIEKSLREFIKSTGYRGPPVSITFPIHYSSVVIQSPHRVNALVSGLQNLFTSTKTCEPLTAVWPFASRPRDDGGGARANDDLEDNGRKVLLQDEDDWLVEWREVIQVAIANRRVGWLGETDKVDAAIEGPAIVASMKTKIEL